MRPILIQPKRIPITPFNILGRATRYLLHTKMAENPPPARSTKQRDEPKVLDLGRAMT